jgi:hypothetical protein
VGKLLRVANTRDAAELTAAIGLRTAPGETVIAAFDRQQRLQVVVPIALGENSLLEYVDLFCQIALPRESLFIVSNRSGELPADRPSDEADWEALAACCEKAEVYLLDWWIQSETYAFSAAEFASTPPGWQHWNIESPMAVSVLKTKPYL